MYFNCEMWTINLKEGEIKCYIKYISSLKEDFANPNSTLQIVRRKFSCYIAIFIINYYP